MTITSPNISTLDVFLSELLPALDKAFVRYCILRNYEGFPSINDGNDIDFLIQREQLPLALEALQSVSNITIVGYSQRAYVANVFVAGASAVAGQRAIQIDFDLSLSWKGLPFLTVDEVLNRAILKEAGEIHFLVPCPVHEAIVSLFARLLAAGSVKAKYFPRVREVFSQQPLDVIASLTVPFGERLSTKLVRAVIEGKHSEIVELVKPIRRSLLRRSLIRDPFTTVNRIFGHYLAEAQLRFCPRTIETISIVDADHVTENLVLQQLIPLLRSFAVVVKTADRDDKINARHDTDDRSVATHIDTPRIRRPLSTFDIARHLIRGWSSQFFGRTNLTLVIGGFSVHDFARSPILGSHSIGSFLARLFPAPDIVISLKSNQLGDRLRHTHRSFYVEAASPDLENSKPDAQVTERLYEAIVSGLAAYTNTEIASAKRWPK